MYCKVFVYGALSVGELRSAVARLVSGRIARRSVLGDEVIVDVLENDEYDERLACEGRGDFLFFPYILEIEDASSGAAELGQRFVECVGDLLAGLEDVGLKFATAADFESQLPNGGRSR